MTGKARRRRPRRREQGAALLIVLFILMMATGTAMYSLQSTQFEQRAAGLLRQTMRTRYVAEGATVGVLAYCYELGPVGCADLRRAPEGAQATIDARKKYGLPEYLGAAATEPTYQIGPADLPSTSFPSGGGDAGVGMLPPDSQLAGGGAAAPYTPGFTTFMEKWQVPNPGEARPRYRLIVSTYGQLALASPDAREASELRFGHETISATRAFFDVR